jgi:hypothetical protein
VDGRGSAGMELGRRVPVDREAKGAAMTLKDRIVAFIASNPDCTIGQIVDGTGIEGAAVWGVLCRADEPDFPVFSTAGGSPERGQTWKFRVQ